MNDEKKPERPLRLDMDFGEALTRYARTKPEQVAAPPGRKAKRARAEPKSDASDDKSED